MFALRFLMYLEWDYLELLTVMTDQINFVIKKLVILWKIYFYLVFCFLSNYQINFPVKLYEP